MARTPAETLKAVDVALAHETIELSANRVLVTGPQLWASPLRNVDTGVGSVHGQPHRQDQEIARARKEADRHSVRRSSGHSQSILAARRVERRVVHLRRVEVTLNPPALSVSTSVPTTLLPLGAARKAGTRSHRRSLVRRDCGGLPSAMMSAWTSRLRSFSSSWCSCPRWSSLPCSSGRRGKMGRRTGLCRRA